MTAGSMGAEARTVAAGSGWLRSSSPSERPRTAVILAAYAEGVRDAAFKHGWRPPAGPIDWSDNDWVLTRLLAVCSLARTLP